MFVDTLGGGLLVPFELIYALRIAHLSLPSAGLILSLAAAAGIAVGPTAGAVVDRMGAPRVVAAANVVGLAGCASLALWTTAWGYALGAFLLSANMRIFWAAFAPLVASIAPPNQLELWFGRLRAARYIGIVAGEASSGLVFPAGIARGLRILVEANGLSFVLALALVLSVASPRTESSSQRSEERPSGGYRVVFADHVNAATGWLERPGYSLANHADPDAAHLRSRPPGSAALVTRRTGRVPSPEPDP
jgi:MFS family permease